MHSGIDYETLYKTAALNGGWAHIEPEENTDWGSIYDITQSQLDTSKNVLDIGTADGIRFLALAPFIKEGVGIDAEPAMIELALAKSAAAHATNMHFIHMDAAALTFPDASFDAVTIRHAPTVMSEIARVLKPGGKLFFQMVNENDKLNLKEAFGRGQDYGAVPGSRLNKYVETAKAAGLGQIVTKVSERAHYFATRAEVLAYLTTTPSVGDYDSQDSDPSALELYITENTTPHGIFSTTSRSYLEAVRVF